MTFAWIVRGNDNGRVIMKQLLSSIENVDAVHDVRMTDPFHHAYIWNDCFGAMTPCAINSTTLSEQMYEEDKYDTGFASATAYEIRVKMKARQTFKIRSIDKGAKFMEVDYDQFCSRRLDFIKYAKHRPNSQSKNRISQDLIKRRMTGLLKQFPNRQESGLNLTVFQ